MSLAKETSARASTISLSGHLPSAVLSPLLPALAKSGPASASAPGEPPHTTTTETRDSNEAGKDLKPIVPPPLPPPLQAPGSSSPPVQVVQAEASLPGDASGPPATVRRSSSFVEHLKALPRDEQESSTAGYHAIQHARLVWQEQKPGPDDPSASLPGRRSSWTGRRRNRAKCQVRVEVGKAFLKFLADYEGKKAQTDFLIKHWGLPPKTRIAKKR